MVISTLKAKLRAWLIDLMREAIRNEFPTPSPIAQEIEALRYWNIKPEKGAFRDARPVYPGVLKSTWDATEVKPEPSFEQMQAESIAAQEKYYDPKL